MRLSNTILIVASSGRLLAQMAGRIGLKPVVIDCFADLDTQRYAEVVVQLPCLDQAYLVPAVERLIQQYALEAVIYGSGFEAYPESLCYLAERLILLGNTPEVFAALLNKVHFFTVLADLGIAHPAVIFSPPDNEVGDWLLKPMQGQGGVGIKRYQHSADTLHLPLKSLYWQAYQAGAQQSVLFVADKGKVQIVGFNTQWSCVLDAQQAFIFSGIINDAAVSNVQKALISIWLLKLVGAFGLQGLNSMDFINTGEQCYVLEINARPSASMQLYAANCLIQHISACVTDSRGIYDFVENSPLKNQEYHAYQVVYAARTVRIPSDFLWPEWCVDLPHAGAIIATNQPICSIIASDPCAQHVKVMLKNQQHSILNKLIQGV
ncbi:MAG: ATP-grasp domain-containing protein [Methylococcales bacterium]|nr:ATP-grasp domain-containing protein [Methylococcales bacterium]